MNNYQHSAIFWIAFCIGIAFLGFLFIKLMIPKTNPTIEENYVKDFNNTANRIGRCENQWQLDNTVYSISKFQHNYINVKDRLTVEQDVNKLIKMWDEKQSQLAKPSFALSN